MIKNFLNPLIAILVIFLPFQFIKSSNMMLLQGKLDTIVISTSAQCEMCKERIEKALAYEKGVKTSNLDMLTKSVSIIYNPAKTNPARLRKAISIAGYDADEVLADEKAYSKLPACCKKPEDPNAKPHSN